MGGYRGRSCLGITKHDKILSACKNYLFSSVVVTACMMNFVQECSLSLTGGCLAPPLSSDSPRPCDRLKDQ